MFSGICTMPICLLYRYWYCTVADQSSCNGLPPFLAALLYICSVLDYYAPPVGNGALSVGFVCSSVAYKENNARTRRPSVPKFWVKVPHLWCDSRTSFQVKRSKVKVTVSINADTHRAPYLPNGKAYDGGKTTIRYDSVYLTCSKKLTGRQLSPPHGTNKKLKCETKNKTMN